MIYHPTKIVEFHFHYNHLYIVAYYHCLLSDVHNVRPHKGQKLVASRLRSLLHSETYPSEIARKRNFQYIDSSQLNAICRMKFNNIIFISFCRESSILRQGSRCLYTKMYTASSWHLSRHYPVCKRNYYHRNEQCHRQSGNTNISLTICIKLNTTYSIVLGLANDCNAKLFVDCIS